MKDGTLLSAYGLDGIVVHTPGHTPGSISLLVENRIAFVGDLLSNTGWPHPQRLYAADWSLVARSLARLQALEPEWIYTGHNRRPMSGTDLQHLKPAVRR